MGGDAASIKAYTLPLAQVVLQDIQPGGMTRVFGLPFPVSSQWAYWAELVIMHFLVPGSSFLGHLCGILAGQLYVAGGGAALLPAMRAYFTPRRRYNDVVGQARADAPPAPYPNPPQRGARPAVADVGGGLNEPEVIEIAPTAPVDQDVLRRARLARFGAAPHENPTLRDRGQPQPRAPRFSGSGVVGRRP
jgi:hypothetical protein